MYFRKNIIIIIVIMAIKDTCSSYELWSYKKVLVSFVRCVPESLWNLYSECQPPESRCFPRECFQPPCPRGSSRGPVLLSRCKRRLNSSLYTLIIHGILEPYVMFDLDSGCSIQSGFATHSLYSCNNIFTEMDDSITLTLIATLRRVKYISPGIDWYHGILSGLQSDQGGSMWRWHRRIWFFFPLARVQNM